MLRPTLKVLGWSFASALVVLGWEALGRGPYGDVAPAILGLGLTPVMGALGAAIGAAILQALCRLLGSKEPFQASYGIVASMAWLTLAGAVLFVIPFSAVAIELWALYLTVVAVERVHAIPRKKAWAVFTPLTLLLIARQLQLALR